jgi:hypothetical protein
VYWYQLLNDEERLELTGDQIRIADHSSYSSASNSVLVYISGYGSPSLPTWFDRKGNSLGTIGKPGDYYGLAISPEGNRIAAAWQGSFQA